MDQIKIFIGYDPRESVAYSVLEHSIKRRATRPVSFIPLCRENLIHQYWRPRGPYDSTEFSMSRWLVPYLCNYEGYAIFMDCDMLCLADIAELWDQRREDKAVVVKQHSYDTKADIKFLGQRNEPYKRKNWSSLVIFNNALCAPLTQHIVNTMSPGLWFHQFNWLPDEEIGNITGAWNHLIGEQPENPDAKLVHYTLGGPWHGHVDCEYDKEWFNELDHMLQGENPVDWRENTIFQRRQA